MNSENNNDNVWLELVEKVKQALPTEEEKNRWDRHQMQMHEHQLKGDCYTIGVPQAIQVDIFSEMYQKSIEKVLEESGLSGLKVKFEVIQQQNPEPRPLPKPVYEPIEPVTATEVPNIVDKKKKPQLGFPLKDNYTFEYFVKGPSNSFAHAAATAVARNPGENEYNPLFIYGSTGLGKTHLMQAIGHYVLENMPEKSVCFISAEAFMNKYVSALTAAGDKTALTNLRESFRSIDLLLLDDVQFIAKTQAFQDEFFNTFNDLVGKTNQIVMTSDVAPRDLKGCEERLIGRFQQGMVVEIESPSYETRLAILKSKAAAAHQTVPEEILNFIAENIDSHVRAIEGALKRVVTFMELNRHTPLTIDVARHLLKDSIEAEKTMKDLTVDEIIKIVAGHYGVKIEDILSKERTQTLVTPRQVAMFLSCKLTTRSLPNIGKSFQKTHATVYHGAQTIQDRLTNEPELRKTIEEITFKLGRKQSDLK